MRADYATSDLISKVNSDWIDAVLVNRAISIEPTSDDGAAGGRTLQPGSGMTDHPLVAEACRLRPSRARSRGLVITA